MMINGETTWVVIADSSKCRVYQYKQRSHKVHLIREVLHPENQLKDSDYMSDRQGSFKGGGAGHGTFLANGDPKKIKIDQKNIQFLSKDATLPHVNNIPCPNQKCPTNKEQDKSEILNVNTNNLDNLISGVEKMNINNANANTNNDVVYIKLNESDLTYLYQCCNCKHTWTNK